MKPTFDVSKQKKLTLLTAKLMITAISVIFLYTSTDVYLNNSTITGIGGTDVSVDITAAAIYHGNVEMSFIALIAVVIFIISFIIIANTLLKKNIL